MADAKKAHGKIKASEWEGQAEAENAAELAKLIRAGKQGQEAKQNEPNNNPKLGGNQQIDLVKAAGKKAIAAAKKDSADLLVLLEKLDEAQNPGRDKKVDPAAAKDAMAKIIALTRKHSVPEATIRQALKNSGYQA